MLCSEDLRSTHAAAMLIKRPPVPTTSTGMPSIWTSSVKARWYASKNIHPAISHNAMVFSMAASTSVRS